MKKIIIPLIIIAIAIRAFAQIPNNGFENWTNMGSYYNPVSWSCFNDVTASHNVFTCERGTPGNPGNYYLMLTSKTVTGLGVVPGVAVGGTFNQSTLQAVSGFAFSQRPANLTGSWQHMIFGTSQGFVWIQLTRWDTTTRIRINVAYVNYDLTGMEMSWANFSIPLTYLDGNNPDSCIIQLSASGSTPHNGDYLYVDNLAFTGYVAGIDDIAGIKTISIYPDPAIDIVTLNFDNANNDDVTLNIYNVYGILVKSEILKQNKRQINIADLSNGIYMIIIKSNEWSAEQKLVVQR